MIKKWIEYALILAGVTVFYIFWTDYLSYFAFLFFIFLPIFSVVVSAFGMIGLSADVDTSRYTVEKGESFSIYLSTTKKSFLPTGRVRIRLFFQNTLTGEKSKRTVFLTPGREEQIVEFCYESPHCGIVECCLKEIRVYDFLGLFFFPIRNKGQNKDFTMVTPTTSELSGKVDQADIADMESNIFSKAKHGDDPSEVFDIREYRDGDRLSQIHWKMSYKTNKLIVKEFSLPIADKLMLLCELSGDLECIDGTLDALASIGQLFLENGVIFQVGWCDGEKRKFICLEVGSPEDLENVWNQMFLSGRHPNSQSVLDYCEEFLSTEYAHIIYFCQEVSIEKVETFQRQVQSTKLIVLQTEVPKELPTSQQQESQGNWKKIDPKQVQKSLEGFSMRE